MEVLKSSYTCRMLCTLWPLIIAGWNDSAVGRTAKKLCGYIADGVRHSAICQLVWRDGKLPALWPDSLTCRILTVLMNLPCALLRWLYRLGKNLWDGSLFFRLMSGIGGTSFLFVGLFLFVMLAAPHEVWDNRYALLGSMALLLIFYLGSGARPSHNLDGRALGPYFVFFMAFVVGSFLSSLSWGDSIRFVGFYLTCFLLVLLTVSAVKRYEQLHILIGLVLLGLGIAAIYGCYQGYIGVEIDYSQQDMSINVGMPGRIYSFFDNPNNFAEILVMLVPMTFAMFLNCKHWWGKLFSLGVLGVCVISLGQTYSRSGWIGFTLAVMVFLAFLNWKLIPLMVVLGICCIPLLPETIYNRILTIGNRKDRSVSYRGAIYAASSTLMKDYWLRGVGLGSDILRDVFHDYRPMFDGNYPIHTHNNYLQMWAELGLFGGISFVAMLFYQLKAGVKSFISGTDRRVKNILAAAVAGFCGILLISVAEYTWFYPRNMFLYFALFGVISCCIKLGKKSISEHDFSQTKNRQRV